MSWIYATQLDNIEDKIDNLTTLVNKLLTTNQKGFKTMAIDFSQLAAAVAAETSVEASAKTLIEKLNSSVASLQAEVSNAPDLSSVQNQISAFAATLNGNVQTLQDALTQNVANTVVANTSANSASTTPNTVANSTSSNTTFTPSGN